MNELNTVTLADFVRNADILWHKGYDSVPQALRNSGLVKELSIPQMTGNTREFSEIDLNEYAKKKPQGDATTKAKVQQGYSKIGYLKRVGAEIGITYEMRTQGKYFEIKNKLTNLGKLAPNRIALDLEHRLGFGEATTYADQDGDTVDITVGDTLALYSTVHTVRGSSTTFRNILANNPQLSRGALEAMEKVRMENCINQFGEKMTNSDNVLWTTDDPNTVNTARELLRATANPTQNNPAVPNVYQGKYTHLVLPRVATDKDGAVDSTKAKRWGVASTEYSTFMLGMHEEPRMKFTSGKEGTNAEDFSTDDINFGVRAGYFVVIVSAGWLCVSYGDGSA